jgi:hypothetical protein
MSKAKNKSTSIEKLFNTFKRGKRSKRGGKIGLLSAAGLGKKPKGKRERAGGIAAAAGLRGRPRRRSVMSLISRAWDKGDDRKSKRAARNAAMGMARTANNAWRMVTRDSDRNPNPAEAQRALDDARLLQQRVGRELGASDRGALAEVIDRLSRWLVSRIDR